MTKVSRPAACYPFVDGIAHLPLGSIEKWAAITAQYIKVNDGDRQVIVPMAINYKAEWEKELLRRQRMGLRLPEPVPHPDDVIIDRIAGTVRIAGPDDQEGADKEGQDLLGRMIEPRDREGGEP